MDFPEEPLNQQDLDAIEEEWVDETLESEQGIVTVEEAPPNNLFIYALNTATMFPGMLAPIRIEGEQAEILIEQVSSQNRFLGFLARTEAIPGESSPLAATTEDLEEYGVAGRLVRVLKMPDGAVTALVQALARFKVDRWVRQEPFLIAHVEYPEETYGDPTRTAAMGRQIQETLKELLELMQGIPDEFRLHFFNIEESAHLADFLGAHFPLDAKDRQEILATMDVTDRLECVLGFLLRELEIRKIGHRIQDELRQKIEEHQKKYLIREQIKALKKELGEEVDEKDADQEAYRTKVNESEMPDDVREKAEKELRRLELLPVEASEYHVIRSYLDWLTELPWGHTSDDNVDIVHARKVLDKDHYGLEEIKERILEVLAVRQLRPDARAPVICLVGPPGVGKTSLGRSIARSLGREFFRFSLGGMRDEAEIKGHRRTYVGAMPGKIIQGLKRAGTSNPVFMLDEIDKLGNDWRGDPSSAMLEVLDPAQNHAFLDHYLDVPVDLSKVMFIATANMTDRIPGPLLDRMEVIQVTSYIEEEKVEIAARYLLPRQREEAGLLPSQLQVPRTSLQRLIRGWTREAGVRNLERQLSKLARKVAVSVARGEEINPRITAKRLPELLGPVVFESDSVDQLRRPGVSIGLAWTPTGGEILFIECTAMKGKGAVLMTGTLGDVMTESARIAMSYVRAHATELGIDESKLEALDVHIHFPAGAVPKDGPSAGIAITTALISLLAGERLIKPRLAMTGELTLSGKVLPVGGIKEKVIAARRAGVKTVLLPKQNEKDIEKIPEETRKAMTIHFVEDYKDVLQHAFAHPPGAKKRKSQKRGSTITAPLESTKTSRLRAKQPQERS